MALGSSPPRSSLACTSAQAPPRHVGSAHPACSSPSSSVPPSRSSPTRLARTFSSVSSAPSVASACSRRPCPLLPTSFALDLPRACPFPSPSLLPLPPFPGSFTALRFTTCLSSFPTPSPLAWSSFNCHSLPFSASRATRCRPPRPPQLPASLFPPWTLLPLRPIRTTNLMLSVLLRIQALKKRTRNRPWWSRATYPRRSPGQFEHPGGSAAPAAAVPAPFLLVQSRTSISASLPRNTVCADTNVQINRSVKWLPQKRNMATECTLATKAPPARESARA
mmetsp:Transcript_9480/g.30078  ORF Transcript_9480/g.30078 Transcript_9480/m.30078 type:complete len:279 (+) Transcript_9480:290-1126(+)